MREWSIATAFSIGTSKATRNVITNALSTFTDFGFEEAKNSLVNKIGSDLDKWRQKTIESCHDLPVELHRVERVIGRAAKDWLAPDIAKIVAMGRAVKDGMATVDETFPPLAADVSTPSAVSASAAHPAPEASGADQASAPIAGVDEAPAGDAAPSGSEQAAASPLSSTLEEARDRGRQAYRAGHSQKAVPPDYRGKPEADMWAAGWKDEAEAARK